MTAEPPVEDACDGFTPGCLDLTVRLGDGNTWLLGFAGTEMRCAVGRSGISPDKHEGDGATPAGRYLLREAFYRPDRIAPPHTTLKLTALNPDDGWCDDPDHPSYNRLIKLPFPASHEEMWRTDQLYDLVIVIGYNDDPPVPGLGSAIFLHLCRDDFGPTAGCVAIPLADMLDLLPRLTPETAIAIEA